MGKGASLGPEGRIVKLVRQTLPPSAAVRELGMDQPLQDAGLRSLDMVVLMLAVEAEFDLEIPQHQMTPENFSSVAAIGRLVTSLSPGAWPPG
jgi:acyl carrier protein